MSTWRTRVAVAAVFAALPLGGCQRDDAPTALDPTPESSPTTASPASPGSRDPWDTIKVPAGAYARWTPTLTGVRAWSADESATLAARVDDAQAREWTATFAVGEAATGAGSLGGDTTGSASTPTTGGPSRCTWMQGCRSGSANRCRWSSASRGSTGPSACG